MLNAFKKIGKRRRWSLAIGLVFLAVVADYTLYPLLAQPSGQVVDHRQNALWLRYTWAFGQYDDAKLRLLADRLHRHRMRDAYFHVRSILPDGSLKYRAKLVTRPLNQHLETLAPEIRRIAWIYAGNPQGRGAVNLSRPDVRRKMAEEAAWLVREGGFDGVQWDYEICPDGDPNLLQLLDETRAALPADAFLSVAVPTWYPTPLAGFGWSPSYFGKVARRCDQLAVMAYDSAATLPRVYVGWVSRQVVVVTQSVAAANPHCKIVLGVPTYGEGTLSHNPHAENLRLALLGVRNGLADDASIAVWQGVGLFADYTTDESEWAEFDRLW